MSTAYSASSPVLVVCGQIERDLIGVDRGMLHEVNDQQDAIRPVTKYVRRIMATEEAPEAVHEAFRQLKTGRPRPVEVEMPPETMARPRRSHAHRSRKVMPGPRASDEQVAEAARILAGAKRPLIWAGGGVISSEGSQPLVRLAERLQAPVITTAEGKGAIDDRHPLALGALRLRNDPVAKTEPNFDVILAVGTRLAFPAWLDGQRVVQIDIDPEELGRNYANTYGVAGDARTVMEQVDAKLAESIAPGSRPAMADEVVALRRRRKETALTPEPQESLLAAVRAASPDDTILVSGMTQLGYYARAFWPTYEPRTFITSSYSGNLGYAYPTALGAKVAQPERPVVALCGDGGFLFNSQEIGHGGAARHQRHRGGVQRQRLRQRHARPGEPLRRPRNRRRTPQPRLRKTGRSLRRKRHPRRGAGSVGIGLEGCDCGGRAGADRGAGGDDANAV